MFRYFILLSLSFVVSSAAMADAIKIINAELPPLVLDQGGKGSGPAVKLAQELAKAAGIPTQVEIVPMNRLMAELDGGNRIAVALTRTPDREDKYQWIGEVTSDSFNFFTVKPNAAIDDVAAAKGIGVIGVFLGGAPHKFLTAEGVTNIDTSQSEEANAKKLSAGRVKSWFAGGLVGKYTWTKAGLDMAQLQKGKTVKPVVFWILASKNVPAETIEKMKKQYSVLKQNGEYDKIFGDLK